MYETGQYQKLKVCSKIFQTAIKTVKTVQTSKTISHPSITEKEQHKQLKYPHQICPSVKHQHSDHDGN